MARRSGEPINYWSYKYDPIEDRGRTPVESEYAFPHAPYVGFAAREDRESNFDLERQLDSIHRRVVATRLQDPRQRFLTPTLPLNFATELFAPSALGRLYSAASYLSLSKESDSREVSFHRLSGRQETAVVDKYHSSGLVRLEPFVLDAIDPRMDPERLPWDAGIRVSFQYGQKEVQLAGPAYVSFDHRLAKYVGVEGSDFNINHYMMIVRAHLDSLRDYQSVMAISMKTLPGGSLTRGLFLNAGFEEYRYKLHGEDEQTGSFLIANGDPALEKNKLSDSEYAELLQDENFWKLLFTLSVTWGESFQIAASEPTDNAMAERRFNEGLKIANRIANTTR